MPHRNVVVIFNSVQITNNEFRQKEMYCADFGTFLFWNNLLRKITKIVGLWITIRIQAAYLKVNIISSIGFKDFWLDKMYNRCWSDNRFTRYFGGTHYWCLYVISGLRREVGENCGPLCHYAAMGLIGCPGTSSTNCHFSVHSNPQERSSPFHCYTFWNLSENEISDYYTSFTHWKMWIFCLVI